MKTWPRPLFYTACTTAERDIVRESNQFTEQFGFKRDTSHQDIPYYKGMDKMHKDPLAPGSPQVSPPVTCTVYLFGSLSLTCLFNALTPEVDTLFGAELQRMDISLDWNSRSWI